ncbi:MAG: hypothetical protein JWO76_206 [Nocardioides sp.]|nr:hypothetical protein [Nocardioides sp.]
MNVVSISKRFAATGAVTALAAGALVATAGAAHAESVVNNTYSCTAQTADGPATFPLFLTTAAPGIGGFENFGLKAGTVISLPALTVTNTFTVPTPVHSLLVANHVRDISVPTYTGTFGDQPVPVDGVAVTVAGMTDNGNGTWSTDHADADADGLPDEGNGSNGTFTVPAAGAQDVVSPTSLDLLATLEDGTTQTHIPCTLADGTTAGAYQTINVVKNVSTTTAKVAKAKFKKGKPAKVNATVTGAKLAGNKVLLKKGAKTLATATLNAAGKASLVTKKLKVGSNKLTVVYKGSGYNTGSTAPVTVKVVK